MNFLVTGAAGFIGFHFSVLLLKKNHMVFGVDDLNSYYDVKLKRSRLAELKVYKKFSFLKKKSKVLSLLIILKIKKLILS